jgi:hypothetical protein
MQFKHLRKHIEELDQKMRILERKTELDKEPGRFGDEGVLLGHRPELAIEQEREMNLNYDQTDFKGGAATDLLAKGEKAIFTRA